MTFFDFSIFFIWGSDQTNYFDHLSKINIIFWIFELYHLSSFIIFSFLVLSCIMVKEIGHFYRNNWSKISTPTFTKPVLSSSASHTSSASNSTWTYISYQLDSKYIAKNQNKNNTTNTDDIHSFVTQQKQNYSVQYTSTRLH